MARSLFVTGAGGYLGRRLLAMAGRGRFERVVSLSRRAGAVADATETVHGDLLDGGSYASALGSCDTVLHLAAATGKNPPAEYFRVNREGTRVLLEQCRRVGVRRFLHVSTIAVKFPRVERYYYAQSKQQAEELVRRSGLDYAIIRPTMIIGKDAPVLEGLSKLAAAPVVPVFGGGRAAVQPVFVDDLARGLLSMLEEDTFGGRTADFGGPDVIPIKQLLLEIRRVRYGKAPRTLSIPAAPVAWLLGLLEKFMLPLLPVTAGQLTSFTSDGTADPPPSMPGPTPPPGQTALRGGTTRVQEVLRMVAAA